ncbi:MAG TPA: hypothetical protein PL106_01050 [Flavobacteriales bacterium]|nr:hypothetical protein [Flavobacteriales bacterium]
MDYSKTLDDSRSILNEAMAKAFVRSELTNMDAQQRAEHTIELAEYVALYVEKVLRAVEVTHLIRDTLKDIEKQKELLASTREDDDGPPQ